MRFNIGGFINQEHGYAHTHNRTAMIVGESNIADAQVYIPAKGTANGRPATGDPLRDLRAGGEGGVGTLRSGVGPQCFYRQFPRPPDVAGSLTTLPDFYQPPTHRLQKAERDGET